MSDLISRKAAILKMEVNTANAASLEATDPMYIAFLNGFKELFREEIDECKAVDAAEVVHARWINNTDDFTPARRCSHCGYNKPEIAGENIKCEPENYCPNCGARMDAPEKED